MVNEEAQLPLLTELAERVVGSPQGLWGDEHYRARLFPGQLPPHVDLDLPLPPGARLVGSVLRPVSVGATGGPASAEQLFIIVDLAEATADAFAFYRAALPPLGWTVPPPQAPPDFGGGFSAPRRLPAQAFCRGDQGPWLAMSVIPREPDGPELFITVHTDLPGPCAGGAPLPTPERPASPIPPVYPPPGVRLEGRGAGRPTELHSLAIAYTAMPGAELEGHIAQQLAAAGWTRREGGVDGPLAWSRWEVPVGTGTWLGVLYVVEEPGVAQRRLEIQIRWQPPRLQASHGEDARDQ